MKTKEVLDKYKKIIAGILKCQAEEIKFYNLKTVNQDSDNEKQEFIEIGELYYFKEEWQEESNWELGDYQVCFGSSIISTFKLYQLPHCCAYMVSCNVSVRELYRNMRIGTILNQLRQDIGRLLGYSSIICTDIEQNVNQRKLLKTNGWKDVHNVVNKRTNNRVYLSIINI